MDHRLGERVSADVPAMLKTDSGVWVTTRITNISIGGLYVATNQALSKNDYVRVEVDICSGPRPWVKEFPCIVIHIDHHGMGLMLSEFDSATLSAIDKLSQEAQPRAVFPQKITGGAHGVHGVAFHH